MRRLKALAGLKFLARFHLIVRAKEASMSGWEVLYAGFG